MPRSKPCPTRPPSSCSGRGEGEPYLSQTALLRRRLLRLLREREQPFAPAQPAPHRRAASNIELTGSAFESSVVLYEQARRHFPETYLQLLKLRMPPYVKIVLSNQFPRSHITTHLSRGRSGPGQYFGPFRSRASAERFESQFLDLFQMRRCQEDLVPSPDHPGCIYGEMSMCLRPCQQVVGPAEYRARSRSRDRIPAHGRPLAACRHRPFARPVERADALRRSRAPAQALRKGAGGTEAARRTGARSRPPGRRGHHPFHRAPGGGVVVRPAAAIRSRAAPSVSRWKKARPVSLDHKLRETLARLSPQKPSLRERQEYLALLARWYYSSWCDGEWLAFRKPRRHSLPQTGERRFAGGQPANAMSGLCRRVRTCGAACACALSRVKVRV